MRGILIPFRRDRKSDFASGEGEDLLASKITQTLATEGASNSFAGELPFRTTFGCRLNLLRHKNNDAALGELARVYVRDALRKWIPDAQLVSVTVDREGPTLILLVRYRAGPPPAPVKRVSVPLGA